MQQNKTSQAQSLLTTLGQEMRWAYSTKLPSPTATFASICDDADYQLFERITSNCQHLLHPLLPPEREQHYSLRERSCRSELLNSKIKIS